MAALGAPLRDLAWDAANGLRKAQRIGGVFKAPTPPVRPIGQGSSKCPLPPIDLSAPPSLAEAFLYALIEDDGSMLSQHHLKWQDRRLLGPRKRVVATVRPDTAYPECAGAPLPPRGLTANPRYDRHDMLATSKSYIDILLDRPRAA